MKSLFRLYLWLLILPNSHLQATNQLKEMAASRSTSQGKKLLYFLLVRARFEEHQHTLIPLSWQHQERFWSWINREDSTLSYHSPMIRSRRNQFELPLQLWKRKCTSTIGRKQVSDKMNPMIKEIVNSRSCLLNRRSLLLATEHTQSHQLLSRCDEEIRFENTEII